jgi:hypothetical protein
MSDEASRKHLLQPNPTFVEILMTQNSPPARATMNIEPANPLPLLRVARFPFLRPLLFEAAAPPATMFADNCSEVRTLALLKARLIDRKQNVTVKTKASERGVRPSPGAYNYP